MSQTVRQTATTTRAEEEEEEGAARAIVRTYQEGERIVRTYQEGERIFVEQSRKFDAPSLERLCRSAGLFTRRTWSDTDGFTLISEVSGALDGALGLGVPLSAC